MKIDCACFLRSCTRKYIWFEKQTIIFEHHQLGIIRYFYINKGPEIFFEKRPQLNKQNNNHEHFVIKVAWYT